MAKGFTYQGRQWFSTEQAHGACSYCKQALSVAMEHMGDASLKTTKYTKRDPFDEPHTADVGRLGEGVRPVITAPNPLSDGGPVTITVPCVRLEASATFRSDATLGMEVPGPEKPGATERYLGIALDETEAALLLDMLAEEIHEAEGMAESFYQDGSGYEAACAHARARAAGAKALETRLGKILAKQLDRTYAARKLKS